MAACHHVATFTIDKAGLQTGPTGVAHLRTLAIVSIVSIMEIERDGYGVPVEPAERMQQVMLGLFDLLDEAGQAEFPHDLIGDLNTVRLRFMDEFERKFPGYGKGRAIWR